MYLTIGLESEKTKELEQYIKIILPEIINENIFADKKELNSLIWECVKGHLKATINELMHGKDFRDYLRDKILKQIKMDNKQDVLTEIEQLCCGNLPKDELLASDELHLTEEGVLSKKIPEIIERGKNG